MYRSLVDLNSAYKFTFIDRNGDLPLHYPRKKDFREEMMMMNHCVIQQKNGFASCLEDVARDNVVCPKPRRSKARTDLLDIILSKSGCGHDPEQIYSPVESLPGSPPSRVSNPLIQDARFVEVKRETWVTPTSTHLQHPTIPVLNSGVSSSSSSRNGGLVRSNFGNKPAVRVEGFEAVDRDGRNCRIPALV